MTAMSEKHTSVEHLFSATYEELRRLASSVSRDHSGETLNPTALVNEAYLKLAGSLKIQPDSRLHFKRLAARAMRQVLVEAARYRSAQKRGGGQALVTFEDGVPGREGRAEEVLALDQALEDLSSMHPRQAQVVECRFFGGLEVSETAQVLGVSESTVERDWRAARAWLATRLGS
jgi:RNA polymerase sigma factor (TIGR02999 family)